MITCLNTGSFKERKKINTWVVSSRTGGPCREDHPLLQQQHLFNKNMFPGIKPI